MTISIGAVLSGASGFAGTITTGSGTTAATGSTFYACACIKNSANVTLNVSDNKGNTYSQIGSTVGNATNRFMSRYQCVNGAGGAGHTFTATESSGNDLVTVFFVELISAATTTPIDQSNTNSSGFSGNPFSSGSITITPPAASEALISCFFSESFADGITFSEANGFTVQTSFGLGTSQVIGAVGTRIVSSAASYSGSWTCSGGASAVVACIDSFIGGSGGGGGPTARAPMFHRTNRLWFA